MKFYDPKTVAISLTGKKCSLLCEHCKGHYLQSMKSTRDVDKERESSNDSYLISGGFDKLGRLPLSENKELLFKLKEKGSLNIHPGFLTEEDIAFLKELDSVVSFDFTQDLEVIKDINHLPYTPEDYLSQFKSMVASGLKVVPHICLGLGKQDQRTLDVMADLSPEKVVLLIFKPTRNTPLRKKEPPSIAEIEKLWRSFRGKYKGELILGCMRPGGDYRVKVDQLAYEAGFDGLVKPAKPLKDSLAEKAETFGFCCAFRE